MKDVELIREDGGNGITLFLLGFFVSGGMLFLMGLYTHSQEAEDEYQAYRLAERYRAISEWKSK